MSITMAHLLEVDIEKTLIFQGITLDIIGRSKPETAGMEKYLSTMSKMRFESEQASMVARHFDRRGYIWMRNF